MSDKPRCPRCENMDDLDVWMEWDDLLDEWRCPKCGLRVLEDDPFLQTCY